MTRAQNIVVDLDQFLLGEVKPLTNDQKRDLLRDAGLQRSGNSSELEARIADAIETKQLSHALIIDHLDRITPWWKFHVYLFTSKSVPRTFQNQRKFTEHLTSFELESLLTRKLALILPESLTLSSINWSKAGLHVTAVRKREYTERDETLDDRGETEEGDVIEYRAFVHQVKRGMVILDWDFKTGAVTLRISELPSGNSYEDVRDEFFNLVKPWFGMVRLDQIDVSKAVAELHRIEEDATGELRSHGIEYETVHGRRLLGRSQSAEDSVLGEEVIDSALQGMREVGSGRSGNFYWLADYPADIVLTHNIHMILVGHKNRANFRVRYTSKTTAIEMTHVLRRLRELSQ